MHLGKKILGPFDLNLAKKLKNKDEEEEDEQLEEEEDTINCKWAETKFSTS